MFAARKTHAHASKDPVRKRATDPRKIVADFEEDTKRFARD